MIKRFFIFQKIPGTSFSGYDCGNIEIEIKAFSPDMEYEITTCTKDNANFVMDHFVNDNISTDENLISISEEK